MVYLVILLRNAIRNVIDLYDLLILASVVVVPAVFTLFPRVFYQLSNILGIKFPFVLMFGVLFFVLFFYLYKVVITLNKHNQRLVLLIQEISLLKQHVKSNADKKPVVKSKKESITS